MVVDRHDYQEEGRSKRPVIISMKLAVLIETNKSAGNGEHNANGASHPDVDLLSASERKMYVSTWSCSHQLLLFAQLVNLDAFRLLRCWLHRVRHCCNVCQESSYEVCPEMTETSRPGRFISRYPLAPLFTVGDNGRLDNGRAQQLASINKESRR